jgi:hypothetical protein
VRLQWQIQVASADGRPYRLEVDTASAPNFSARVEPAGSRSMRRVVTGTRVRKLPVADQAKHVSLALLTRRRWCLKAFGNAKLPNNKFVNFQSSDSGTTDRQSTDG